MQQTHFAKIVPLRYQAQLMAPLGARDRKPSAEEGRAQREAGVRPRLPNRAAEVSEVQKMETPRNAFGDVRACICFQHSAYTARSATQHAALHCTQRYATPSVSQRAAFVQFPALHCTAHIVQRSVLRGSKPFAGEAERSGKRGYCAAFNEALPVQQRLETLPEVLALAIAFSTAHIKRAARVSWTC